MPALATFGWVLGQAQTTWQGTGPLGSEVSLAHDQASALSWSSASRCLAVLGLKGGLQVLQLQQ